MNKQKLMKVTYYDPKNNIRLTGYSDTVVWDDKGQPTLMALRFGGYPEEVRGLADAIFGGITIEIESEQSTLTLKTLPRQYRREISHDGVYAEATLVVEDDGQLADSGEQIEDEMQEEFRPGRIFHPVTPTSSARLETGRTCFGRWTKKPLSH